MKKSPDWEGRWDWLWKWKGENEKSHRIGKADGSDCFRKRDFFLKKKTFVCNLFKCVSISNTYSCRSLISCFDFHSVCVSGPSIASSITSTETFFSLFFEKKESDQLHVFTFKISIAKSCRSDLLCLLHPRPWYLGNFTPERKCLKNLVLISWTNKPSIGIV